MSSSNGRNNATKLREVVSADNGDASVTITWDVDKEIQVWATPLTADRTVTLSTTNAINGSRFRIIRKLAATGVFNLNVGTGPLIQLSVGNEFCDVTYDGSAWFVSAYGTIYVAI